MFSTYTLRSKSDRRFTAFHFIMSDINAVFLRKWRIESTIVEFKQVVRNSTPAFVASAGNTKKAPLMNVNVYDIRQFCDPRPP